VFGAPAFQFNTRVTEHNKEGVLWKLHVPLTRRRCPTRQPRCLFSSVSFVFQVLSNRGQPQQHYLRPQGGMSEDRFVPLRILELRGIRAYIRLDKSFIHTFFLILDEYYMFRRRPSLTPDPGRPRNNASIPEYLKFFFIKTGAIVDWGEEFRELLKAVFEFFNFLYHCRVKGSIRRR
jgi:hypothetical protein